MFNLSYLIQAMLIVDEELATDSTELTLRLNSFNNWNFWPKLEKISIAILEDKLKAKGFSFSQVLRLGLYSKDDTVMLFSYLPL